MVSGYILSAQLTAVEVAFGHLVETVAGFPCKATLLSFPILFSLCGSHGVQSALKEQEALLQHLPKGRVAI